MTLLLAAYLIAVSTAHADLTNVKGKILRLETFSCERNPNLPQTKECPLRCGRTGIGCVFPPRGVRAAIDLGNGKIYVLILDTAHRIPDKQPAEWFVTYERVGNTDGGNPRLLAYLETSNEYYAHPIDHLYHRLMTAMLASREISLVVRTPFFSTVRYPERSSDTIRAVMDQEYTLKARICWLVDTRNYKCAPYDDSSVPPDAN